MLRGRHKDHQEVGGKKSEKKTVSDREVCAVVEKEKRRKLCYGFSCRDPLHGNFVPVGCALGQGIGLSLTFTAPAPFCHPSSSEFGAVASLLHMAIAFLCFCKRKY